ncbi:MAG: TSUP family transporter [Pseudonocardiaceae bacterium]|nr:TSUP family transporter [Pseudonocardiaceae bacterium]
MSVLIVAGLGVVFVAALLGGLTGFGYNLMAMPLMLLLGMSPATAVVINLAIALITRVAVVFRLLPYVRWRRALLLTGGSIPGLFAGAWLGGSLEPDVLRVLAGVLVLVIAPLLMLRRPTPHDKPRTQYALAGFAGGALGTSTSLNGVPVALTLSADVQDQRSFIADLAVFFVGSNIMGLAILLLRDGVHLGDLALLGYWLPGALVANWIGTALAERIAPGVFRVLTCVLVMAAGAATLLSA